MQLWKGCSSGFNRDMLKRPIIRIIHGNLVKSRWNKIQVLTSCHFTSHANFVFSTDLSVSPSQTHDWINSWIIHVTNVQNGMNVSIDNWLEDNGKSQMTKGWWQLESLDFFLYWFDLVTQPTPLHLQFGYKVSLPGRVQCTTVIIEVENVDAQETTSKINQQMQLLPLAKLFSSCTQLPSTLICWLTKWMVK